MTSREGTRQPWKLVNPGYEVLRALDRARIDGSSPMEIAKLSAETRLAEDDVARCLEALVWVGLVEQHGSAFESENSSWALQLARGAALPPAIRMTCDESQGRGLPDGLQDAWFEAASVDPEAWCAVAWSGVGAALFEAPHLNLTRAPLLEVVVSLDLASGRDFVARLAELWPGLRPASMYYESAALSVVHVQGTPAFRSRSELPVQMAHPSDIALAMRDMEVDLVADQYGRFLEGQRSKKVQNN